MFFDGRILILGRICKMLKGDFHLNVSRSFFSANGKYSGFFAEKMSVIETDNEIVVSRGRMTLTMIVFIRKVIMGVR